MCVRTVLKIKDTITGVAPRHLEVTLTTHHEQGTAPALPLTTPLLPPPAQAWASNQCPAQTDHSQGCPRHTPLSLHNQPQFSGNSWYRRKGHMDAHTPRGCSSLVAMAGMAGKAERQPSYTFQKRGCTWGFSYLLNGPFVFIK